MPKPTPQTGSTEPDRSATLAFRASETTRHLVRAVAARQQLSPSDWLRDVVETALDEELSESKSNARRK